MPFDKLRANGERVRSSRFKHLSVERYINPFALSLSKGTVPQANRIYSAMR
ncbi:hypothetical protein [Sphingomonas sp. CLY1604]|uniref:hypothetical protein n=1 Tax=Sphingomonas sp. CLY1604 TaxID=3457786 RepID=UPI003FD7F5C0